MRKLMMIAFTCVLTGCLLLPLMAQKTRPRAASPATLARGRYLVEEIGKCGDCHSPRNEKGEFIQDRWLGGAPLGFKPTEPMPVWADQAPAIAGLPGWEKDDAIKFLVAGVGTNRLPPRPPMPQYHFHQADAEAVVAYLKSLPPAK